MVKTAGTRRRSSVVILALVFCAFVVELSPHLVHHVFDHDTAQADCPFALGAERDPSLIGAVAAPTVDAGTHPDRPDAPSQPARSHPLAPSAPRAPPAPLA
jgi:hypothetical protein